MGVREIFKLGFVAFPFFLFFNLRGFSELGINSLQGMLSMELPRRPHFLPVALDCFGMRRLVAVLPSLTSAAHNSECL